MPRRPEDPIVSLRDTFAFAANDWSLSRAEAWAYGIVLGWGAASGEIAARFGWTPDDMARLDRLHARFAALVSEEAPCGHSRIINRRCDYCGTLVAIASEEVG